MTADSQRLKPQRLQHVDSIDTEACLILTIVPAFLQHQPPLTLQCSFCQTSSRAAAAAAAAAAAGVTSITRSSVSVCLSDLETAAADDDHQ
eukprot:COSAG05_NODE_5673_length_1118_cov_1.258096_1_plen_90_part_01